MRHTESPSTPVPDFLLERLHQLELDPEEERRVRARGEAAVEEALQALARADRTFHEAHPPARVVAGIRAGLGRERTTRFRLAWLWPVAGLAAVPFLVGEPVVRPVETDVVEVTRDKGDGAVVKVWRRDGSGAVRLGDDAVAKANDVLQLGVGGVGDRYGVLLSIDGRGVVTRHVPEEGDGVAHWPAVGEVRLPRSYTLDDAPDFERFVLVSSDAPFEATAVLAAARSLGADPVRALSLPEGLSQVSFVVRKEAR